MTTETLQLVARTDSATGELGLINAEGNQLEEDMPQMDTTGIVIAHDYVEHQQGPEKIGLPGDELIALGGIWYARGQYSDIRRDPYAGYHAPDDEVSTECIQVIQSMMAYHDGEFECACPYEGGVDDWADTLLELGVGHVQSEAQYGFGEEETYEAALALLKSEGARWIQHGWNLAEARFGDAGAANRLFWNIQEVVEALVKQSELWEGAEFELIINDGHEVTWREAYEAYADEMDDES